MMTIYLLCKLLYVLIETFTHYYNEMGLDRVRFRRVATLR